MRLTRRKLDHCEREIGVDQVWGVLIVTNCVREGGRGW